MDFYSVLYETLPSNGTDGKARETPAFLRDLNLDQVLAAITKGGGDFLQRLFYTPVTDPGTVYYRHEVFRDLEDAVIFESIKSFSHQMAVMRQHLAAGEQREYKHSKERWFLDAAAIYVDAVEALLQRLEQAAPGSRALLAFRDYLASYVGSERFKALRRDTKDLQRRLSEIRYNLLIDGLNITVRPYESEVDYSAVIEETFAKFKQGAVKDYLIKYRDSSEMGHVEARILELVAQLNPEVFRALDEFCTKYSDFLAQPIAAFDREVQFYVAYLEHIEPLKRAGLPFCYPQVSNVDKNVSCREGFDLALASKLAQEEATVVCNDFALEGPERIIVVTGANQGGKTTFARMFGQLHYLASLGCPVPGAEARLFLFDRLFTHFEREESIATLRGKLQDDLVRIHSTLAEATPNSIVIMNEIFSSTSAGDASYLGKKVLERISRLDLLCVCVTFLDELSRLNEKTVSMVATVVPEDPTVRTHKIERRPADGLAYAQALARKYGLTYEEIKRRTKP